MAAASRSYREAEALLADSPQWCSAIGMCKAPDHNTLCRAAKVLLRRCSVNKVLDAMARWASRRKLLRLSQKPLALDSTYCQSHHVSRHYERRCAKARRNIRKNRHGRTRPRGTARTLQDATAAAQAGAGRGGRGASGPERVDRHGPGQRPRAF